MILTPDGVDQAINTKISTLPGGATGPQGAAGVKGDTGAAGVAGAVGPQGPIGLTGATGAVGPQGLIGLTGATGPIGAAGPQGISGATGAVGPQGPIGLTGANGATGAVGPQGPIGLTGATGAVGPQGPIGPNGAQGAQGAAGPQGATGSTGATGATGANGAAGAQGPQGPIGPQGPTGPVGPTLNNVYGVDYLDWWDADLASDPFNDIDPSGARCSASGTFPGTAGSGMSLAELSQRVTVPSRKLAPFGTYSITVWGEIRASSDDASPFDTWVAISHADAGVPWKRGGGRGVNFPDGSAPFSTTFFSTADANGDIVIRMPCGNGKFHGLSYFRIR